VEKIMKLIQQKKSIKKKSSKHAIVLLSGGLDSTVTLWWVKKQNYSSISCLTFEYGSKEEKVSLPVTEKIAKLANVNQHLIIALDFLKAFSQQIDSALVSGSKQKLPSFNKPDNSSGPSLETAEAVWIPGRNLLFLAIATSFAETIGRKVDIITGFNAEEAETFPDNSQRFIDNFNRLAPDATMKTKVEVVCPLANLSKEEIVTFGSKVETPFAYSVSCYQPQGFDEDDHPIHCGHCESCIRRKEAFRKSDIKDPTSYLTKELK
jgi:7-cyano-7-deazaguanine synthase